MDSCLLFCAESISVNGELEFVVAPELLMVVCQGGGKMMRKAMVMVMVDV